MTHDRTTELRLLSLPDAARMLCISLRTLRTLIAAGKLAVVRVTPRRIVVDTRDIEAYVEARRESAL